MSACIANRIVYLLACAGAFVALVLGMTHLAGAKIPCGLHNDTLTGCDIVAQSPISTVAGVPIAFFGLALYLAVAGGTLVRERRGVSRTPQIATGLWVLLAAGTFISAGLLSYAWIGLNTVCTWCTASGVLMLFALIAQTFALEPRESPIRPLPIWTMLIPLLAALVVGIGYGTRLIQQAEKAVQAKEYHLPPGAVLERTGSHVLGANDAPVTVVVFADLQCPACRRVSMMRVLDAIETDPQKKVRLVYRHFPHRETHSVSFQAALLAEWAGLQGRYWDFIKGFLREGNPSQQAMIKVIRDLGLDIRQAEQLLRHPNSHPHLVKKISVDRADAQKLGVDATPIWYIRYPDGRVERAYGTAVLPLLRGKALVDRR